MMFEIRAMLSKKMDCGISIIQLSWRGEAETIQAALMKAADYVSMAEAEEAATCVSVEVLDA